MTEAQRLVTEALALVAEAHDCLLVPPLSRSAVTNKIPSLDERVRRLQIEQEHFATRQRLRRVISELEAVLVRLAR